VEQGKGRIADPEISLDRPDQQRQDLTIDKRQHIGRGTDKDDIPAVNGCRAGGDGGSGHARIMTPTRRDA
jgi:hypothetical protein